VRKLFRALALAAIPALTTVAACKKTGSGRLEGHWRGARAAGVAAAAQEAANKFAAKMDLTVKGNLLVVSTAQASAQPCTFVIDDETKTSVAIHTEDAPQARELFVFTDDKDALTWSVGDGRSIFFRRVKD
jgi:hypothetical protein